MQGLSDWREYILKKKPNIVEIIKNSKLISTDVGNLYQEQVEFLVKNNVLIFEDGHYGIRKFLYQIGDKYVPAYSMFCAVRGVIESETEIRGILNICNHMIEKDIDIYFTYKDLLDTLKIKDKVKI